MDIDLFNKKSEGTFPGMMGIEITAIEKPIMRAEMPIRKEFLAPNGFLHAGTVITFADTVAGYSTVLNLPENAKLFTTIELKSNFMSTLREGTLVCESEPSHLGRTTQVWNVKVRAKASNKLLATFSCTQMILY